jgi:translation elongation factor EF-Tu-like GTPase
MLKKNNRVGRVIAIATFAAVVSGCTKQAADESKQTEPITFKAQASIPVLLTLLKDGARTSPIGNHYRPQFRFPLAASELTCAVELPAASPALEPGQTANASLSCGEEVRIERGKQQFTVFEGGKPVGSGLVQLP